MEIWIVWIIGVIVTLLTKNAINKRCKERKEPISQKSILEQVIMHILAIICISLVGGIAVAKFLAICEVHRWWEFALIAIIPSILTYLVGWFVLGLGWFDLKNSQIIFLVVFVCSIVVSTKYCLQYNRNIEIKRVCEITSTEVRQILDFNNIPVQDTTGEVSGSAFLGGGSVSGEIFTTSEIPYWYKVNEEDANYDTAPAKNSKIRFIEEGEKPYLEIIEYCHFDVIVNHNNGIEKKRIAKEIVENQYLEIRWKEYIFHLPKSVMRYAS